MEKYIGATTFFRSFIGVRTLWLAGRFGGGKTLLAFGSAIWLYENGYADCIVSNIPSNLSVPIGDVWIRKYSREEFEQRGDNRQYDTVVADQCPDGYRPGLANAAVVFDEAWILLDAREWKRQVGRTIGAYLRKYNLYLILPSVFPVDVRFRQFYCQRVLNLAVFGFPMWIYKWRLECGLIDDGGTFGLWRPSALYGTYDHLATPSDDAGITDAMAQTQERGDVNLDRDAVGDWTGDVGAMERIADRARGRKNA